MKLPYQVFIALRYLKSKKRHKGLSVNTAISIGGVAVGVMALLVVLSVMSGFQQDIQRKILGANAHIVIRSYKGEITDFESIASKLSAEKEIVSFAPFVMGQVMLTRERRAHGVYIRGVDPEREPKTTDLVSHIKDGSFSRITEKREHPGIVLGRELASSLGAFVGDTIYVVSPLGEIGPLGMLPKMKRFEIVAIFEMGMFEYDSNLALTDMKSAQEFFGIKDGITGVQLKLKDFYKAADMRKRLQSSLGFPYNVLDWMQMNRNLFSALKLEKFAMFVILILIILVASFNIISNLIMNVIEKSREIAILKAMGATNSGIMAVFMLQGTFIGLIGTVIGVVGGYLLGYVLNTYEIIKLPPDVYYLSRLPVRMEMVDFIAVSLSAMIISVLATVYPAWQASKLNPVEPLRYE